MTVAMTKKQEREIMRKWAISSTKIIEKLEIRIEELEKNYGKALQKIAELDKENTELSKKLWIQPLQKE